MKFHITWPDGTKEESVSECENLEGFLNERFGEPKAYHAFLDRGGVIQSDEEVQAEFHVFEEKLARQNLEQKPKEEPKEEPKEDQTIKSEDVGGLDKVAGEIRGE